MFSGSELPWLEIDFVLGFLVFDVSQEKGSKASVRVEKVSVGEVEFGVVSDVVLVIDLVHSANFLFVERSLALACVGAAGFTDFNFDDVAVFVDNREKKECWWSDLDVRVNVLAVGSFAVVVATPSLGGV